MNLSNFKNPINIKNFWTNFSFSAEEIHFFFFNCRCTFHSSSFSTINFASMSFKEGKSKEHSHIKYKMRIYVETPDEENLPKQFERISHEIFHAMHLGRKKSHFQVFIAFSLPFCYFYSFNSVLELFLSRVCEIVWGGEIYDLIVD